MTCDDAVAQVYEQRARPDPMHRNLDRSYHLAMSHRGMGAVEKVLSIDACDLEAQALFHISAAVAILCVRSNLGEVYVNQRNPVSCQVGVDMSKFREFPYRGSLLRFQSGAIQEVFHEPMSAKVPPNGSVLMFHMATNAVPQQ